MDHTAKLRRDKKAIEAMQQGEKEMRNEQFSQAERLFKKALKQTPQDYAALMMMAKCQLSQEKLNTATRYANLAKQVNPTEAQAHHVGGIAKLMSDKFNSAYQDFKVYEKMLPGNANTSFLKGMALEGMQDKKNAAAEYARFLKASNQGGQAEHARQRLMNWGYLRPSPKR